jgi:hypothetical protein
MGEANVIHIEAPITVCGALPSHHGFCRVRVSLFGLWLVRCAFFTMDSAVLGLASLGCGWYGARF